MKIRKVNRYTCEHCGKRGLSARHMSKHERGCTMNPNRVCRMCVVGELQQRPIGELLAILPEPPGPDAGGVGVIFDEDTLVEPVKLLREKTDNCPACILAALRQKRIPVFMAPFNFTKEVEAFWAEVNDRKEVEAFWAEVNDRNADVM